MDQEKITQILSNIEKEDFENVGISFNNWMDDYLHKKTNFSNLHWQDMKRFFKEFRKNKKFSEEDFRQAFKGVEYEEYLSPEDFPIKKVSMKKKQIIAFELANEIDLDHDKIVKTLSHLYDMPARDWNYKMFIKFVSLVDKEDHARLKIKKVYPYKKAS